MSTALFVKDWTVKLFELKVLAWLEQGCWVVMDVFILERRQLPAGRRCSIRKHDARQKPDPAPKRPRQLKNPDTIFWVEEWYENQVDIWKLRMKEIDYGWMELVEKPLIKVITKQLVLHIWPKRHTDLNIEIVSVSIVTCSRMPLLRISHIQSECWVMALISPVTRAETAIWQISNDEMSLYFPIRAGSNLSQQNIVHA